MTGNGKRAERPNHKYYRALHGKWRGEFQFVITDWRKFGSSSMGWWNKLMLLFLVVGTKLIGALVMETEVDYRPEEGKMFHQIRLRKWGMVTYQTRETFALLDDGTSLSIRGEQRLAPAFWRWQDIGEMTGEIDESGTRAIYRVPFLGIPMTIETQIVEGGADIRMSTEFSEGLQRLRAA